MSKHTASTRAEKRTKDIKNRRLALIAWHESRYAIVCRIYKNDLSLKWRSKVREFISSIEKGSGVGTGKALSRFLFGTQDERL